MPTTELTAANFDQVVTDNDIVLVDFWASWCGPCRMFAPIFEAASDEHPDIVFGKVDTEAEQELAGAANITSIPTLMAFRDKILVFAQPGALPAAGLAEVIAGVRSLDMDDVRRQLADREAAAARSIEVVDLAAEHAAGATIIDVREPGEYGAGHVPGAKLIPMGQLPSRVAEVPTEGKVYVICRSGNRSRSMVDFLVAAGIDAINVEGGTVAWEQAGYAIATGSE